MICIYLFYLLIPIVIYYSYNSQYTCQFKSKGPIPIQDCDFYCGLWCRIGRNKPAKLFSLVLVRRRLQSFLITTQFAGLGTRYRMENRTLSSCMIIRKRNFVYCIGWKFCLSSFSSFVTCWFYYLKRQ